MGIHVREKSGRLYLDVNVNGKRYWKKLDLRLGPNRALNDEMRELADTIRQEEELKYKRGEYNIVDPVAGKTPLVSYAEEIAKKQDPKNPLPKSLKYLREYAGNIALSAITERWIDGYRAFLLEQETLGKSTAGKYFYALGMILRRALRENMIQRNPAEAVRGITAPEVVKVYLTAEELGRLSHTPIGGELGAEVKRAFLFASMTGLRVSDIRSLSWGDIDRDALQILKRQVKTGRVVSVPLHPDAWGLINDKAIHKREELVFPRLSESKANTNQYITAWVKAAGIEKPIGWHSARHTFAVLSLEGGADFYTVSKLLGHTKPMTTAVYAKATDEMRRRAVNGLPGIE
jgi:integrase